MSLPEIEAAQTQGKRMADNLDIAVAKNPW